MSYGTECPSHGVYARVTEVKHWIQYIAGGALDTNCNEKIPLTQGNIKSLSFLFFFFYFISALLVTGGANYVDNLPHLAEVILPDGRSCTIPDLPGQGRNYHTQSGYTACGGCCDEATGTTCASFIAGQWESSHTLRVERYHHVSWRSPNGTLLMGGRSSAAIRTTELLSSTDSTTTELFSLTFDTR